ncbi:MAG: magnesium chelatase [Thermoprotei archaeon]|nr:MAG: magnesium chelatase [Thermoprotei archaeon]RLF03284.1 MAG: magnesium chelatase [Thermoprotei archaeon]
MCIAVDPSIGGLLIIGPKGTGKSSIVRAFARLLPEIEVVVGCPFNDDPSKVNELCDRCRNILEKEGRLPVIRTKMKVVELPIGATEDMVLGTINIERTLKEGRVVFEPGILARANRNILYIDEVNLLPDHIVDSILDAAAFGWNVVEREGISLKHPAKFILVGTMNPEEGELRPQLLDRFSISVRINTLRDPELRKEIVKRNLEFERNPEEFCKAWQPQEEEIRESIIRARAMLSDVKVPEHLLDLVVQVCSELEVDGYRPDIVAIKTAKALAALKNRTVVDISDIKFGLSLALAHRTRAGGLKPPPSLSEIEEALFKGKTPAEKVVTEKKERRVDKRSYRLPPFITFFR